MVRIYARLQEILGIGGVMGRVSYDNEAKSED